jgi:sulfite reductase beta subunit-like hemoprotein
MALTLEAEQSMRDVGLIAFYEADAANWLATSADTKAFLTAKFPVGSPIRRDDVAKGLVTVLEVHEEFKDFRNEKKLRAKYWIKHFADLVVDRTWDQIP